MPERKRTSLPIGPDVSTAKTLPKEFYLETSWFEKSKQNIFAPSWQFIGDAGMLEADSNIHPFTLFEGFLDEPLVLTRDAKGDLHCLSNVCTHRGNIVASRTCRAGTLRCGYHGRVFGLDGKCLSMPEFKTVKGFPAPADNLVRLPLHRWEDFLFVSLEKKRDPAKMLGWMADRVGWLPFSRISFSGYSKDYALEAHWALYCENYLEGFHIPYVHPDLNKVIDQKRYDTELSPFGCLQVAFARKNQVCFDIPASSPDFGKRIAAYYFFLFPNLMFNFYPWGLSVNVVKPTAPDRCKVSFLSYPYDESKWGQGAGAHLDQVEMEDEEVVCAVQRGIRSRFYRYGRYSATHEQGVHHFHRMVASAMKGTG